jgi:predicted DNA-binding transcriptional regulator AlpA
VSTLLEDEQLTLPETGFDRFVRYAELKDFGIPFSRTYLAELEARGRFPARVRLSPNTIAWKLSELRIWAAERGGRGRE